ncbi:hypothetical protein XELAEV_18010339mg [Xenopus laevis]|uniref:Phosphatidylinositol 4,5-bisphosphate 5-phosphatase A n=1 Tax=Xenopus laevis TaxID=8355 RepID=A0A974DVP0_XENLA|nr:hypothetical protein XELAEV_18010339mg [Xenopus laevis]
MYCIWFFLRWIHLYLILINVCLLLCPHLRSLPDPLLYHLPDLAPQALEGPSLKDPVASKLPSQWYSSPPVLSPVGFSAPDRSQPEGSQRLHPLGSPINVRVDSGRSQPEGSCPSLLSPTRQYPPLPPPPSSPHRSPITSPRGSREVPRPRHRAHTSKSHEQHPPPDCIRPSQAETEISQGEGTLDGAGKDFRIYFITWNVGCAVPPSDLTSLLCLNARDDKIDMFVIGLQEVNSMINKRLKDALFSDQWSEVFMDVLSPFSYVLVSSVRMQGCLLLVFSKYFHLPFLRDIQTDCTRTGLGGYWGNKGGVSIQLSLFGHMVCFLNFHLPAHMENTDQRVDNFESILHLQQFQGPLANGVLDHDLVFWFGDLNFRIEDLDLHFVKSAIQGNKLALLWEKDQLNIAKIFKPVLNGFMEGPLTFPPTYKFDVGTNTYDTSSKKRKPAWTDRILWKMKSPIPQTTPPAKQQGMISTRSKELAVTLLSYGSHVQYTESDHKPVSAIFSLQYSSCIVAPLVQMLVHDEWLQPDDAHVIYRWSPAYMKSSWDWIGLYSVGFRHHKDYVSYVWAKSDEETERGQYQHEELLSKTTSEYLLGYFSNNLGTLIGITEPFQICLPDSEAGSSSDSSDSSSEEEDSTHILLRPKSRSPSPASARSPRSRSPALARLHDLILPNTSSQKSRSPSPKRTKSPKHDRAQRSRSRETTRHSKGKRVESPHVLQAITVPIMSPAAVGQGSNPQATICPSPSSPKPQLKLQSSSTQCHRDSHSSTKRQELL